MERKTAKKPNPFIQGIATFLNGWKEKQQKKPRSIAQRGFSICLPLLTAYEFDKNNAFLSINKKTPATIVARGDPNNNKQN
jgi:hypothetical protein